MKNHANFGQKGPEKKVLQIIIAFYVPTKLCRTAFFNLNPESALNPGTIVLILFPRFEGSFNCLQLFLCFLTSRNNC